MPEPIPLGLTFLLAITLLIVSASLVKIPWGGNVEMVLTLRTQFFFSAMASPSFLAFHFPYEHECRWSAKKSCCFCCLSLLQCGVGHPSAIQEKNHAVAFAVDRDESGDHRADSRLLTVS